MKVNRLYGTWFQRVTQLFPSERVTRRRNLAALISGIAQSKSVHVSHSAEDLPGKATALSQTRRLDRFLENPAVQVRTWYESVLHDLLTVAQGQPLVLIMDASKVGFQHQLLLSGLAYQRRTLPLAWDWIDSPRGHSSSEKQLALLAYLHTQIASGTWVIVVGDAEFGAVEIMRQLEAWGWYYVLRQKSSHLVRMDNTQAWQPLGDLVAYADESIWCPQWQLTQKHAHPTNLLAHWARGESEPWLLATNLPTPRETLRAYGKRMWIEETFGDLKDHGFDLESTHLRKPDKLSRLTFAVVLLYLSLISLGAQVIKNGTRYLVDRRDRRDLSLFRIGWRMLKRRLANLLPIRLTLIPYFP